MRFMCMSCRMRRWWWLFFSVLVVGRLMLIASQSSATDKMGIPPEARDAFERGTIAGKQKSWDLAVQYFTDALKAAPDNPLVLYDLGVAESKLGRDVPAAVHLKASLEMQGAGSDGSELTSQNAKALLPSLEVQIRAISNRIAQTAVDAAQALPSKLDRNDAMGSIVGEAILSGMLGWVKETATEYPTGLTPSVTTGAFLDGAEYPGDVRAFQLFKLAQNLSHSDPPDEDVPFPSRQNTDPCERHFLVSQATDPEQRRAEDALLQAQAEASSRDCRTNHLSEWRSACERSYLFDIGLAEIAVGFGSDGMAILRSIKGDSNGYGLYSDSCRVDLLGYWHVFNVNNEVHDEECTPSFDGRITGERASYATPYSRCCGGEVIGHSIIGLTYVRSCLNVLESAPEDIATRDYVLSAPAIRWSEVVDGISSLPVNMLTDQPFDDLSSALHAAKSANATAVPAALMVLSAKYFIAAQALESDRVPVLVQKVSGSSLSHGYLTTFKNIGTVHIGGIYHSD